MKTVRVPRSVLLVSLLIAPGLQVSAQVVDISACRAIEDRLDRFLCYENLGSGMATQPAGGNATSLPVLRAPAASQATTAGPAQETAARPAPAEDEIESFGRRSGESTARVIEGTDGKSELRDTVASLELRGPNIWVITLASGQRWLQKANKQYPMREGDEVRIYSTRWGGFRLSAARLSGFIQVERLD